MYLYMISACNQFDKVCKDTVTTVNSGLGTLWHYSYTSVTLLGQGVVRILHYNGDTVNAMATQITGVWIVYKAVCSGADQRKHQSSASLAYVRGIHRWQVNSPDKGPVTRKMFPFDDVIMTTCKLINMKLQIMGNFYQTGQTKHFLKGFIPLMKSGSHVWYLWQPSRSQLLYKMCLFRNQIHICDDVTWASWRLRSPADALLVQLLVQAYIQINQSFVLLIMRESTGDRWIPRTEGLWRASTPWCQHK